MKKLQCIKIEIQKYKKDWFIEQIFKHQAYLDTYREQKDTLNTVEANVEILQNKKIIIINQYKKAYQKLRNKIDRFVRSDVIDLKSLQQSYQKFGKTKIQKQRFSGSDSTNEKFRNEQKQIS